MGQKEKLFKALGFSLALLLPKDVLFVFFDQKGHVGKDDPPGRRDGLEFGEMLFQRMSLMPWGVHTGFFAIQYKLPAHAKTDTPNYISKHDP